MDVPEEEFIVVIIIFLQASYTIIVLCYYPRLSRFEHKNPKIIYCAYIFTLSNISVVKCIQSLASDIKINNFSNQIP